MTVKFNPFTGNFDVAGKPSLVFNVKDYGAKGDDSTNDTTAIQAAITAAASVGGIVFFPDGIYQITDKLTLSSGITIQGVSDQYDLPTPTCMIKQTVTNKDIFYGSDVGQVTFRNLCMQGYGSGTGIGINLVRSSNPNNRYFNFENLYIRNTGGDGIYATNMMVSVFKRVICETIAGDAFHLEGLAGVGGTSLSFIGCYANGVDQAGFHLETMIYCSFVGCAADDNGIAYKLDNCQGISFTSCGTEGLSNNGGIYLGIAWKIEDSNGVGLYNCYEMSTVASGKGIWLTDDTYGITIVGFNDINPGEAAKWLYVDSGCTCTVVDPFTYSGVTNNGAVTYLNDSTGAMIVPKSFVAGVSTLTPADDAVTPNAYTANTFLISHDNDLTINNPTSSQDGQRVVFRVKNTDASDHTITLGANFRFGSDITALTDVVAGETDYIGCIYNNADTKWDVVAYVKGY